MMNLVIFAVLIGAGIADKLQSNYLPPLSAGTADGSGFLTAPARSFSRSGVATSYGPPASGPVPAGHYGAPTARTRPTGSFQSGAGSLQSGVGSFHSGAGSFQSGAGSFQSSAGSFQSGAGSYSGAGTYSSGVPVAILRSNNENNGDGAYKFEYETENRISQHEEGHLQNVGTDQESSVVHGSYSYQSPEGQTITVNYVADENGFRPVGDHLPTPPPVPEAILKSLEVNAAAGHSEGGYEAPSSFGRAQSPQVNRQYLAPRTGGESKGYQY